MLDRLLGGLSAAIITIISALGYGGVFLLMAIESACIPLPSEITMPFAGYLVSAGRFELQLTAMAGALGCLAGSYIAYFIGASGARRLLERYGRWVLIAPHELEIADRFFERWASPAVYDLYPRRVVYMVSRAGMGRDETRAALGGRRPMVPSFRHGNRDGAGDRRGGGFVQPHPRHHVGPAATAMIDQSFSALDEALSD
jgi:hypothetical protein